MEAMCGRYVATTPTSVLADIFDVDEALVDEALDEEQPSYNVAPTDPVPAVAVNRSGQRALRQVRWGLVPSWSSDAKGGARMINARVETVMSARAFRAAFERRRCLVPADGFYEWERRGDGSKQPWFVHRADGRPIAMAGIWEVWRPDDDPDRPLLRTCAVITTSADRMMESIHDRMPVVLPEDVWSDWLDPATAPGDALTIATASDVLVRHPVGSGVNSVRNNDPVLIEAVPAADPPPVPLRLL
jgi:putative SOS response-associated peptidase YedK